MTDVSKTMDKIAKAIMTSKSVKGISVKGDKVKVIAGYGLSASKKIQQRTSKKKRVVRKKI